MDKLFRYIFQDSLGLYYYVFNGSVVKSSFVKYLEDDPAGWEDMQVSFDRNEERGGVFRKSTVALKFHSDAAKILRHIFYTFRLKGYCKLTVQKQNRDFASNDWQYVDWYSCEIDLGQTIDGDTENIGDIYFSARLLEMGVPALLEANGSTPYEVPIYTSWTSPTVNTLDPDAIKVRLGSISLGGKYEWLIPETLDISGNPTVHTGDGNLDTYFLTESTIFNLGTPLSSDFNGALGLIFFDAIYDFTCTSLKITCDVAYTNMGGADIQFQIRLLKYASNDLVTVLSTTDLYTDPNPLTAGNTRVLPISINYAFLVEKDHAYRMDIEYVHSGGITPPEMAIVNGDGSMTMDVAYVMPDSYCYGFRYIDYAKKLVKKVTNNLGAAVSNLLSNSVASYYKSKPYNCIVVPGASIRNLDNPVIKGTHEDLEQDLKVMYSTGVSSEGTNIRFEQRSYFYQKTLSIVTLRTNGAIKKTFANDYTFNKIKVGFPDALVDEVNGLQEFCAEQNYSCGILSPGIAEKELNLVSPYIHGMYSIENIRSYLFRTDTDSTTKDNEVCVIEVGDTPVSGAYEPKRQIVSPSLITGLLYPSEVFNLAHSPKACLIRNLSEIKAYLVDGDIITFQTALRNAAVTYGTSGAKIVENSNIEITTAGAKTGVNIYTPIPRTFLPFVIESKGEMPFNLVSLMETTAGGVYTKYGVIRLNDGVNTIDVFVLDCGITPGTEDAYLIRGLCSPDTNINNFIR